MLTLRAAAVLAALVASAEEQGSYLVRLCPEASSADGARVLERFDLEDAPLHHDLDLSRTSRHVHARFDGSNRGYYVGGLSTEEAAALRREEGVCRVLEEDVVGAAGVVERGERGAAGRDGLDRLVRELGAARDVERGAAGVVGAAAAYNWGVDRISRISGLSLKDGRFSYEVPLTPFDGRGVFLWVLDSGLDTTHCEFQGNDRTVANVRSYWGDLDEKNSDVFGHGTHVAAVAGGATVGVASGAHVLGVKVLNDEGLSGVGRVVAALQYVREQKVDGPSVVLLSLEGKKKCVSREACLEHPMYLAVKDAVEAGIVVALAAGNVDDQACDYWHAVAGQLDGAIVVGASDLIFRDGEFVDGRWEGSNFGRCVDVFAPGANITSAAAGTPCRYAVQTGTSMAAPLVAGVAAQHLQAAPDRTPAQVEALIRGDALQNVLEQVPTSSPNLLLQAADEGSRQTNALKKQTTVPTVLPTILPTPLPTS